MIVQGGTRQVHACFQSQPGAAAGDRRAAQLTVAVEGYVQHIRRAARTCAKTLGCWIFPVKARSQTKAGCGGAAGGQARAMHGLEQYGMVLQAVELLALPGRGEGASRYLC